MIDGARWLPSGERRQIGINCLTAKILCRRHNSALSPLDTVAGEFFRMVRTIDQNLLRRSLSRKDRFYLVSGEAIEAWMLKVACGLFYSKVAAKSRMSLADDHTFDQRRVDEALLLGHWDLGCGLYMRAPLGHIFPTVNAVAMAPVTNQNEKRVVGVGLILSGLEFQLVFDMTGAAVADLTAGWFHRPSELLFENPLRRHVVVITWPPGSPQRSITLAVHRRGIPVAAN